MYQRLYAEKLEKQEKAYLANIEKMKAKQNSALSTAEAARRSGTCPTTSSSATPHGTTASPRSARRGTRRAAAERDFQTRVALGEQVKAKQERLDRERRNEMRRHERFARS